MKEYLMITVTLTLHNIVLTTGEKNIRRAPLNQVKAQVVQLPVLLY